MDIFQLYCVRLQLSVLVFMFCVYCLKVKQVENLCCAAKQGLLLIAAVQGSGTA